MLKYYNAAFVAAAIIIVGSVYLTTETDEDRINMTVKIEGEMGGSGFAINPTHVITNKHVVQAIDGKLAEKIYVTTIDGKIINAKRIIQNPSFDLAIIETEQPIEISNPVLDCHPQKYGEKLTTYGRIEYVDYGMTELINITIPKVTQINPEDINYKDSFGPNALLMRGFVQPGNSGGAVYNESGSVVGVSSAFVYSKVFSNPFSGQVQLGVSVAISSIDICNWLTKINVKYKKEL